MISVRFLGIFITLVCAIWSPAHALDPLKAQILTLRLGMSEPEVTSALAGQGVRPVLCEGEGCASQLRAKTKDGWLRIEFGPSGRVNRIAYSFTGRSANEAAAVRSSVLDRYGPPSTEAPMSWCRGPSPEGRCPPGQPRLTFEPGDRAVGILTLAAGD